MWILCSLFEREKSLMGANMETMCGAQTEEKAIQRLSYLGIHPVYSHQNLTVLWMLRNTFWKETDIALWWKALPDLSNTNSDGSQPTIGLSMVSVMGVRERTEGAEGVCNPIGRTVISTNQTTHCSHGLNHQQSSTYDSSCLCSRRWPCHASMGGEVLDPMKAW